MPMIIISAKNEQIGYDFKDYDCTVEEGTLPTGDYTVKHLEKYITVERKEFSDMIGCITTGRDRFKRELHRMQAYKGRAVIIEGDMQEIVSGNYRSKVLPKSVLSSIAAWTTEFEVPFIFAGNRTNAERMTYLILMNFYNRMQTFCKRLVINEMKDGK